MFVLLLLLTASVTTIWSGGPAEQPQLEAPDTTHYAILINERPVGYARVVEPAEDGPQVWESETFLKLSLLGQPREIRRIATTRFGVTAVESYQLNELVNESRRYVECRFEKDKVLTWTFQDKEAKGEPVETPYDDVPWVLGGNDFGHFAWMAGQLHQHRDDESQLVQHAVFTPDAPAVQTLAFQLGEPREVTVFDTARDCDAWDLVGAGLTLLVDPSDGQLIRIDIPAQNTIIELAGEEIIKLVDKSAAEEVLADHFAQSNVVFDDFLKVTSLQAKVDVRVLGEGLSNDAGVLTTRMQQFDGRRDDGHVQGTVTIQTNRFDGSAAPAFPYAQDDRPQLQTWLEAGTLIESDDPQIASQAKELTSDAADSWQATLRISDWVHREIRYKIADSPSAKMAFEKRVGDCGPHSTLTVAMLRAVGIPARLVGGLVYTPSFGGSFGQHAWVEVWMGEAGWIGLDPTTGETDAMSATHIKLFEGLGGVVPESIEVLDYQPANREVVQVRSARPIPWTAGQEYTYRYRRGSKLLGDEIFTIAHSGPADDGQVKISSQIKLSLNPVVVESQSELSLKANGYPVQFHREITVSGQTTTIQADVDGRQADVSVTGAARLNRQFTLPENVFCFDNNMTSCFAVICSQLQYQVGEKISIATFHPSSIQIIPMTISVEEQVDLEIGDQTMPCYRCRIDPINNTFWITEQGRLVKATQGDLTIELLNL